jgi:nitroreductase
MQGKLLYTLFIKKRVFIKQRQNHMHQNGGTMKHKIFIQTLAVLTILAGIAFGQTQDLQPISLPQPQKTGGKPLMDTLNARKSTRSFSAQKLSQQMLSNLLWAAFGQNREMIRSESVASSGRPGRTAPSGMNLQEIDIYVALAEGVYVYEAASNRLLPVLAKDIRATVNRLPIAADAAVGLIYVEDTDKKVTMPAGAPPAATGTPSAGTPSAGSPPANAPSASAGSQVRTSSAEVDAGFIGQNVYLFCASEGLGTFFHATDREGIAKTLNLRPAQRVLYSQTVGYAAN